MPVGPSPLALHGARGRLDRLPLRSVFGYNGIAASTAGAPGTSREQRCSTKSRTLRPLSTLAQRPATCSFRPTCNSRSQWPPRFFHGSPKRQAEPTDHYQTLDLTPDATQAEIKKCTFHIRSSPAQLLTNHHIGNSTIYPRNTIQTTTPLTPAPPHVFSN